MIRRFFPVMMILGMALLIVSPALADETLAEDESPWESSLGFSFVSTSGNSDTQTIGFEFALKRKPEPWGLDAGAYYLSSEDDGDTTAERYGARLRGERALSERWNVWAGLSGEHDAFAGYDLRTILGGGAAWTAVNGEKHELVFDGGLTWTSEDLIDVEDRDYLGGLLGLTWAWHPNEGTTIGERLVWFPNFDTTSDWRLRSETSVEAALSTKLALKLGYLVRYDNEPVPGYDETDTTTTVSLVVHF